MTRFHLVLVGSLAHVIGLFFVFRAWYPSALTMDTTSDTKTPPQHAVLYPAFTWDYYLTAKSKVGDGFGVVARRNIRKGELIFSDSFEYTFTDVQNEGDDYLLLDRNQNAAKKSKTDVPERFPLTRDVLLRTHGVPHLNKESNTVTWQLEVPGMLINHSCDPNVIAFPRSTDRAEDYAARDIKKGEELTVDYALQYYDEGPLFEKCQCGAPNCRGKMMGFVALSDQEKEKVLPRASDAVQAMHKASTGEGPPIKTVQEDVTRVVNNSTDGVPRLVVPGPSHALADVIVKRDETTGEFGLYALKDFAFGERVYEFWSQKWPSGFPDVLDMVFAQPLTEGDPPEGTIARVDAQKCASQNRAGRNMFSCWELLTKHSCEPNLVYDNGHKEDEYDDWRGAYAARDIKVGEQLTVDYNCMLWDRTESPGDTGTCDCGASKCTGTKKGFKFLSRDEQQGRKAMSWKRVAPPYEGEEGNVFPGEALAPVVRSKWRKDKDLKEDAPDTAPSGSSSSSEESD